MHRVIEGSVYIATGSGENMATLEVTRSYVQGDIVMIDVIHTASRDVSLGLITALSASGLNTLGYKLTI